MIETLVGIAHATLPPPDQQRVLIEQFCSTLDNIGLQRHLLAVNPANLDEAVRAENEYIAVSLKVDRESQIRQLKADAAEISNEHCNSLNMERTRQRSDNIESDIHSITRPIPQRTSFQRQALVSGGLVQSDHGEDVGLIKASHQTSTSPMKLWTENLKPCRIS